MDSASLYAAFALSPAVSGFLTVSPDGKSLTFTPGQPLQWQTRYTITIAGDAADTQRNTIGLDYTSHLFLGTDLDPPSVTSLRSADGALSLVADDPGDSIMTVISGWEATEGLVISFSEPVLTTSAAAAIQISPTAEYAIQEENSEYTSTLTYSFPNRLAYGVTYTVSTLSGVQDSQGNRSTGGAAYHFLVNGPTTAPPVVTRIAFPVGPADPWNNVLLVGYDSIVLPLVTAVRWQLLRPVRRPGPGATLDRFFVGRPSACRRPTARRAYRSFAVEVGPAETDPAPKATVANEVVARVWVPSSPTMPTQGRW